jgi:HPt (histidine-containing phosphotransfer) domain-containing protein
MYYIVNHTEHIIAADKSLLDLLSLDRIDELYTKIALGDIQFTRSNAMVTITAENHESIYPIQSHILSGVLGDMTLIQIDPSIEKQISLLDDEYFDLLSGIEESESIEIPGDLPKEEKGDTEPIMIDIESISQEIGISTNEYKNFLNEYIDTALDLEEDLKSTEEENYTQAISTLSHLSNILHLPVITNIIEQLEDSQLNDRVPLIESLYTTISRLTTIQTPVSEEERKPQIENSAAKSFGSIDLDEVQPLYFNFQMETSASDLSLPLELIQEFIHDFIKQAHIETGRMLEAYGKGDLNTIQNIGQLLKEAASNLHIPALSEPLHKIEVCKESSNVEHLIKKYWGLFLSFEDQVNSQLKK